MSVLKEIIEELNTPDDFRADWYGYATNQVAHLAMGLASACIMSGAHFLVFGEFAKKGALFFVISLLYITYELSAQGWKGKDTVEDWVFFAVYGAGVPIFLFSEIEIGSPMLSVNVQVITPIIGFIVAHIIGGIIARVYSRIREK